MILLLDILRSNAYYYYSWKERKGRVANLCSAFHSSKCTHTAVSSEHTPRAVGKATLKQSLLYKALYKKVTWLTWNRRPQGNKDHGGDWILQANSAPKVRSKIACDCRQDTNQRDGHNEACPSIPILCGWDECKENLPEDCEEVHDVIKAGWKTLFTTLLLIIVTWDEQYMLEGLREFKADW